MIGSDSLNHELADFAIRAYSAGLLDVPGFDHLPLEEKVRWGAYLSHAIGEQQHEPLRKFLKLSTRKWKLPTPSYDTSITGLSVRHLLFHVCPLSANSGWYDSVTSLQKYLDIFDGRKVVAIAQDTKTVDASEVMALLPDCEFMILPNDPILREVVTFLPLLLTVYDQPGVTMYLHSKKNSTADGVNGANRWVNCMLHYLLCEWENCVELLKKYVAVGTTKMVWPTPDTPPYPSGLRRGTHMLSGTFFWFNNAKVFSHPRWRDIAQDRYGAESWLAGLFGPEATYSVYQPWDVDMYPTPSPYDPSLYPEKFDEPCQEVCK